MRRALPGGRPPTPQRQPRNDLSFAGVTRDVLPLFDAGAIRVVVDTVVPLRAYLVDQFMGCGQSCCV
jgi:hypothetical protein